MFRRNLLYILYLLAYFVVLGAALFELDRTYYQERKGDIVRTYAETLFPQLDTLQGDDYEASRLLLLTGDAEAKALIALRLQQDFDELVGREWSVFRIRLMDANLRTVIEASRPDKIREYNSFENSLFLLKFRNSKQLIVKSAEPAPRTLGYLEVSWTTPRGESEIAALTVRFRWIALALAAGITAIFFILFLVILRPLRRVSGAIERSKNVRPILLPRPGSSLERGYNELARDALIARLNGELRDAIARERAISFEELYGTLVESIFRLFPFAFVQVLASGPTNVRRETVPAAENLRRTSMDFTPPRGASLAEALSILSARPQETRTEFAEDGGRFLVERIAADGEEASAAYLALGYQPRLFRGAPLWPAQTAAMLAEEARKATDSLRLHHTNVFRQKSEASINLAENLGHDLTNIIATAKLDLNTLKQILQRDIREVAESPRLREIMSEAIAHLLANTRFLQEIVNIYRAFTNLKKPRYELTDLNGLVADLSELFFRSIASAVQFERSLDPAMPNVEVEPRLIKLALFNLLSNAQDAIKEAQLRNEEKPRVFVGTEYRTETQSAVIVVRDTGKGLRNESGAMASAAEIRNIFSLGFSTKKEDRGEGLGLSWVRSIVAEFHGGQIEARNHPEGGAEFRIVLPVSHAHADLRLASAEKIA